MSRSLSLLAAVALPAGLFLLANCSNPLGLSDEPPPPVTVVEVDTLLAFDTLTCVDTVVITDTVLRVDTLYQVDTVLVYLQDSCGAQLLCARLGSHRKEIVWMLSNPSGRFRLEFASEVEQDKPRQVLAVDIDGTVYLWCPQDNGAFTPEADLDARARVRITPENPSPFGHAIDICLSLTPL